MLTLELEQESRKGIDTRTDHVGRSTGKTRSDHGNVLFGVGLDRLFRCTSA